MNDLVPLAGRALSPAQRIGVLLVNLGTPDSPSVSDVRRYLREFLSDPRVIDIPAVPRWLLLNLVILPFRPKKSAHAYSSIWTKEGSPLLVYEQALTAGVAERLGDRYVVELGMRYGNPSIPSALAKLGAADVSRIVVLPLFPQYAAASTGSAVERVLEVAGRAWNVPALDTITDFYDEPGFIGAFAEVARPVLAGFGADHVLFSYHGVPERHVTKGDPTGRHCLATPTCCDAITSANRSCYRAQCFATTRALATALGLGAEGHSMSFQSRLGRTPWIRPYTDEVLPELAKRGKKRLAVMCPAFVADCLETLEEIGMRAKEQWKQLGGEDLVLVPSLNAHPAWIDAVAALVRREAR
ncbi:ferrochelatase [Myxococcota bacterium]|nr:ferrochelatase [Myxococcota bacterium]